MKNSEEFRAKKQQSQRRNGKIIAVSNQAEIEEIILSGGFENPTLFYQSLFIKGWFATDPSHN